jgi:hypothetical protein
LPDNSIITRSPTVTADDQGYDILWQIFIHMKFNDILKEGREPKDFWSDEHQQLMKDNRKKQIELNEKASTLRDDLVRLSKDIENTNFSDPYGNTYRIGSVNLVKSNPEREQPDDGVYKLKHTFNLNLWVEYRFYGDMIPHTLLEEPVKKMWELVQERFSEMYDLSQFKFNIGNERMYYELGDSTGYVDSQGDRRLHNLNKMMDGDMFGTRGLVECGPHFEMSIAKLYIHDEVKINQVAYDKESLDKKYKKIYDVLRKGDISLPLTNKEPLVAHYELNDSEYEKQGGFKYFTLPEYNYDTGVIESSKVRVRLVQALRVSIDDPAYDYRMPDIRMLVEKRLISKFKQFNIDLIIKFT